MTARYHISSILTSAFLLLVTGQAAVAQAGLLTARNVPSLSEAELNDMMTQLKAAEIPSAGSSTANSGQLLVLLERLRDSLTLPANVTTFRQADDQAVISRLVEIASADEAGFRYNAASILANVTDNKTVCVVINRVLDRSIDIGARYNLLQTVKVVSTFSDRDNSYWIKSAINQIRSQAFSQKDADKTLQVLNQIDQFLGARGVQARMKSLQKDLPPQFQQCNQLPFIAAMEARRKEYKLYIHTKRPASDVQDLNKTLADAGLSVIGSDPQADPVQGFAVDYNPMQNDWTNQALAEFVADTINTKFFVKVVQDQTTFLPRMTARKQSTVPEKSFGIWLDDAAR